MGSARGLAVKRVYIAVLKEHWGPLWTRDNPTPAVISDYLSSYTKRLDLIPSVSLESVLTVLAKRRDSSAGLGIPFSVYRLLADIVTPLFLRVFRNASLAVVVDVLPTAPSTLLTCSFSRRITRTPLPTSVTLRTLVLIFPAILKLMDPAQRARHGAPIDENVAFFSEGLYAAVESNQNYHLLLHDFEKAFDRIVQ